MNELIESIRNIFDHNIGLIGSMDRAVCCFREQEYEAALCLVADSMDEINLVLEAIITNREYFHLVDTESMLEMLTGILNAKKSRDFILLADLLELQLISFLTGVQELIISKEEILFDEENYKENIRLLQRLGTGFPEALLKPIDTVRLLDNGYRVEFTSSGLMTLAAENEGLKFYFHTNSHIQAEAFALARHWYQIGMKRYVLYGFGMGYHICELIRLAKDAELEIYEGDLNVIQLACAFAGVRELLQNERITLYYDPDLKLFGERIGRLKAAEAMLVHYPSYKNIRSREGKRILEDRLPGLKAIFL